MFTNLPFIILPTITNLPFMMNKENFFAKSKINFFSEFFL